MSVMSAFPAVFRRFVGLRVVNLTIFRTEALRIENASKTQFSHGAKHDNMLYKARWNKQSSIQKLVPLVW